VIGEDRESTGAASYTRLHQPDVAKIVNKNSTRRRCLLHLCDKGTALRASWTSLRFWPSMVSRMLTRRQDQYLREEASGSP
jgi:hypothetical protein